MEDYRFYNNKNYIQILLGVLSVKISLESSDRLYLPSLKEAKDTVFISNIKQECVDLDIRRYNGTVSTIRVYMSVLTNKKQ